MSTLTIIVLTILAAIFGLILLASVGVLIYLLIRQRQMTIRFDSAQLEVQSAITKSLADHSATLTLLSREISSTLETHRAQTDVQISKIHGEDLAKAAQDFLSQIPKQAAIATRVEKATLLFIDAIKEIGGEFEISGSAAERARASGLGPEDYAHAAPDEHFVTRTRTSASDAEALAEESATNTQSFNDD